jgi:hypothetical protein
MNTKRNFLTAAATTAIVGLASLAPAQAASFSSTSGISFGKDTTVTFEFLESAGLHRSELKVFELDASGNAIGDGSDLFGEIQAHDGGNGFDFTKPGTPLGTCGITVLDCETNFTFEAGKNYTLGLYSYFRNPNGTNNRLESISYLTQKGWMRTSGNEGREVGVETEGQLFLLGSLGSEVDKVKFDNPGDFLGGDVTDWLNIGIDDSGNSQDADYNDFKFRAKAVSTPEPTVLLGLAVAAGGMFMTRRNKNKAS